LPVLGQRTVPVRVRIGAVRLHRAGRTGLSLPPMPAVPLDSPLAFGALVVQQVLIGLTLGFAVRWCSPRWNSPAS
jgi:flagellar biosynthetic protein FliR